MVGCVLMIVAAALLLSALAFVLIGERGRLLRRSTLRVARDSGLRRLFSLRTVHGYVYARWPRQYIGLYVHHLLKRLGPRGRKWLADHYHGKVLTTEHAKRLITVEREIPLRDLEQIIPYPMARKLLVNGPPEVAVFDCPCRRCREHPCEPVQVCMIVGQPFVDFLLEHHPHHSRRLTQQEAVELLDAEHRRGHLHAAFFKDVCLERLFAICNCCKCCCGGVQAMVRHGVPMMASSGYVARVDQDRCNGCAVCQRACPFEAMTFNGKARVDRAKCLGCGVCQSQCAEGAVCLEPDPQKGIPLDVRLLTQQPMQR